MAAKYHIVPDTGEAKPCSAGNGGKCKYADSGAIHGNTVEEARSLYEKSMSDQTFAFGNAYGDSENITEESFYDRTHFSISDSKYEKALKKIENANRRLDKAGIADRFEIVSDKERFVEKEKLDEETNTVVKYAELYHDIEINEPKLSYDGYEFQAVMNAEGDGFIVRSTKEVELNGERPDSMYCEHCGHNRKRAKTYLIKGPDGEVKQIGSRCVEAYLGVRPEGLWALEQDFASTFAGINGGKENPHYTVDETLAMALAASDNGLGFQSSSSGLRPTSYDVDDIRFGGKYVNAEWRSEMLEKTDKIYESGEVQKLRKKIMDMEPNNDYVKNLQTAINQEYYSSRNHALVVSAVSIIAREERMKKIEEEKERKRKLREETFKPGHVGQPGDKMKNVSYEVMEVKEFTTSDPYSYYGGDITKYVTTMRDEDGHKLTYFASEDIREFKGEDGKVFFTSGRIKEHKEFEGQDQTVLSHMRVKKPKRVPDGTDGYGNRLLPGD